MRLTGKIMKKITHPWHSVRRFDNLLISDLNIIPQLQLVSVQIELFSCLLEIVIIINYFMYLLFVFG